MKLYRKIRKRTAKKRLSRYWKKLEFGRNLKPGDLISTCNGYNEIVEEIEPVWCQGGRFVNRIVVDFNIKTTAGGYCSLIHCCEDHLQSRDEVETYWLSHDNDEYKNWYNGWSGDPNGYDMSFSAKIVRALCEDKEVFTSDGQLNKEAFRPDGQ